MSNREIANTILNQLGRSLGNIVMMTGAKNFVIIENGVRFNLPARSAKNGINLVRIVLEPTDTYFVEFIKYSSRTLKTTTVASHEGVYNEMLKDIFEKETGLYLSF